MFYQDGHWLDQGCGVTGQSPALKWMSQLPLRLGPHALKEKSYRHIQLQCTDCLARSVLAWHCKAAQKYVMFLLGQQRWPSTDQAEWGMQ